MFIKSFISYKLFRRTGFYIIQHLCFYSGIDKNSYDSVNENKTRGGSRVSDTESCSSIYQLTGSTTNCEAASSQSTLSRYSMITKLYVIH